MYSLSYWVIKPPVIGEIKLLSLPVFWFQNTYGNRHLLSIYIRCDRALNFKEKAVVTEETGESHWSLAISPLIKAKERYLEPQNNDHAFS